MAILLPFAVQLSHDLEHHHEHACLLSDLHIGNHEHDCDVFHFKIDQNTIDFPSEVIETKYTLLGSKIITSEAQLASIKLTHKSSRAPPVLLF